MWEIISPVIANTIALVLTGLIGWAVTTVQKKYNIEIEESYRTSLHQALMSGVNSALARIGTQAEPLSPARKIEVIDQAVAYAKKSVPDAIKKLGPSAEVMGNLAASKLLLATQQQIVPAVAIPVSLP